MELPRTRYLDALIRRMWNGSVKVVTGIRRCGKSYLLNELFVRYLLDNGVKRDHIITIALDSISNVQLHDPIELNKSIRSLITDGGEYYIILDEIQMVDNFEALLNEYVREKNVDVYVSGSNSHLLSKDIVTEFRGRGDEVRVHPLSFSEYYSAVGGDERKALKDYLIYGGMPRILSIDDRDRKKYLADLFDEVYLKDIIERNKLRSNDNLESVANVLLSSIGSLTNPKKIADTLRTETASAITRDGVVSYIGYMVDSFLFERAERFDVRGREYIGAQYKYYVEDIGLRNAKINFRQTEYTHLLENIVYNELRVRGYNVDVGVVKERIMRNGESSSHISEIDFVVNLDERRYYIQVSYSVLDEQKMDQEVYPLMKVHDSFKKILVTADDVPMSIDENGVIMLNIYDFLLNEDIMERC